MTRRIPSEARGHRATRAVLVVTLVASLSGFAPVAVAEEGRSICDGGGEWRGTDVVPGFDGPVCDERITVPTEGGEPVELALRVFLPETGDAAPYPTILFVTPYSATSGARTLRAGQAPDWTAMDYAFVVVDVRGTGASGGELCLFCLQEQRDLYEVLDWIAHGHDGKPQPWTNGDVGMTGGSYSGISGLLAAAQGHPALKAVVAKSSYADIYREAARHNGMLNALFINAWTAFQTGASSGAIVGADDITRPSSAADRVLERPNGAIPLREALAHPYDTEDGWYQERSVYTKHDRITVPTLLIDGWFDGFSRGAIWNFRGIASDEKRLLMLPAGHSFGLLEANNPRFGTPGPMSDEYNELRTKRIELENEWFRRFLKRETDEVVEAGLVEYYDVGAGELKTATSFPPSGSGRKAFYLSGSRSASATSMNDGTLGQQRATDPGATQPDRYDYRPSYGVTDTFGKWGEVAGVPQVRVDQRADETQALTYTTAPLSEDLEIAGPMELRFFAETTAEDMDWVVKVSEVLPEDECRGTTTHGPDRNTPNDCSTLMTSGYLKASHREVDESRSLPAEPWILNARSLPVQDRRPEVDPIEYRIDIWPTAWTIKEGHRLRITIASSDVPNHPPSPYPGTNTIYHDARYQSRLLVTVAATDRGRATASDERRQDVSRRNAGRHASPVARVG